VNELKVDRAFVTDIATDDHDQAIVRSVVAMAHTLGLSVIAEGVEDQPSLDLVSQLGCDAAQGYHVRRPASADEITDWILDHEAHEARTPATI
jgi:diguanylate cyclase